MFDALRGAVYVELAVLGGDDSDRVRLHGEVVLASHLPLALDTPRRRRHRRCGSGERGTI